MFIPNSLRKFQRGWQKSSLHPSYLVPLLHVTHIKISLFVTASTWLTWENWFSRLPIVCCLHGYIFWLSCFAGKILSAGVTYRPCPSISAKKRTDCHAGPGATSCTPGRAAQAVATTPQPPPALVSQRWCPTRASQSSVLLCTILTRMISEQLSASALFSVDGDSSIPANLVTPAAQAVELGYVNNN